MILSLILSGNTTNRDWLSSGNNFICLFAHCRVIYFTTLALSYAIVLAPFYFHFTNKQHQWRTQSPFFATIVFLLSIHLPGPSFFPGYLRPSLIIIPPMIAMWWWRFSFQLVNPCRSLLLICHFLCGEYILFILLPIRKWKVGFHKQIFEELEGA